MSQNPLLQCVFFALSFILPTLPALPLLPEPDPAPIQPFFPAPSPPATIPAFPEQADLTGCPLDLPDELFHAISNACGGNLNGGHTGLKRSRCCPVLAAWLYSAYSATALGRASKNRMAAQPYDLPVLPDDSETCVGNLENAMMGKGIQLPRPNETCDVVYCYCGIRLRPLSCLEAFVVSKEGKLVGGESVKRLERDCLNNYNKGHTSHAGCSKCLNTLYQLNEEKRVNSSKSEGRKSQLHSRDCELMGLTWLLAKNRTAYIPSVSAVLRALLMSRDGSDPQSCRLKRDGIPLAVDSAELDSQSSANTLPSNVWLNVVSLSWIYVCAILSSWF